MTVQAAFQIIGYLGVFGEEHLIISVRALITNLFFKERTFLNSGKSTSNSIETIMIPYATHLFVHAVVPGTTAWTKR